MPDPKFRKQLSKPGKAAYDKLSDLGKDKAEKVYRFISLLTHTEGKWAGKLWQWIPWQEKLIITFFGTVDDAGYRIYRFCYCEIPKKSGKTEIAAAIALYMLIADGEAGAEVYSAAVDREQAARIYRVADYMVMKNTTLEARLKCIGSQKRIVDHKTNSFYLALSREYRSKHGFNPSCVIFDETHEYPDRKLYDILVEGTETARDQQVIFIITTAGVYDQESIGWQLHTKAKQIADGIIEDSSFLPILYCADKDKDDWEDEEVWKRLNPALGYIFDLDKIRKHYDEVKQDSARVNNFMRYRLNMWVAQISKYIPMDAWNKCDEAVDIEALKGRTCFGGLDLSSTQDLTAFVLVFPPKEKDEKWKVIPHCFIPEDTIVERSKREKVDYLRWKEQGYIMATDGNVVDYRFVQKAIIDAAEKYNLREVAYDPWNATETATYLRDHNGINMVEHRQGFKSMSEPLKKLLKHVLEGKIAHAGHPVLRFCADNLVVRTDESENVRPAKDKSVDRIDLIVALAMALGRALIFYKEVDPNHTPLVVMDFD